MRSFDFDFIYDHGDGNEYTVEVEAIVFKQASCPESDWDSREYVEITDVRVYLEGYPVKGIEIPDAYLYNRLNGSIRNAQVSESFNDESGEF